MPMMSIAAISVQLKVVLGENSVQSSAWRCRQGSLRGVFRIAALGLGAMLGAPAIGLGALASLDRARAKLRGSDRFCRRIFGACHGLDLRISLFAPDWGAKSR